MASAHYSAALLLSIATNSGSGAHRPVERDRPTAEHDRFARKRDRPASGHDHPTTEHGRPTSEPGRPTSEHHQFTPRGTERFTLTAIDLPPVRSMATPGDLWFLDIREAGFREARL